MRFLLIIAIACGAIGLALAVGLLRPGLTNSTLERYAESNVATCMHAAGYGGGNVLSTSLADEQQRSPRRRALERCWSQAAHDERFARLEIVDPIALMARLRKDGFAAWACAERAGYRRTTAVPLSGPGGYPLQLAAGNFRVGSGDDELERFYRVAASCSGDPLDAYRWSDGTFSRQPADGVTHCTRHEHHGSGSHSHGCYGANSPVKERS